MEPFVFSYKEAECFMRLLEAQTSRVLRLPWKPLAG